MKYIVCNCMFKYCGNGAWLDARPTFFRSPRSEFSGSAPGVRVKRVVSVLLPYVD